MSEYFPKPRSLGANVKVELDLSSYETKANLTKCNRYYIITCFVNLSKLGDLVKNLLLYIMLRSKTLKIKYLILLT